MKAQAKEYIAGIASTKEKIIGWRIKNEVYSRYGEFAGADLAYMPFSVYDLACQRNSAQDAVFGANCGDIIKLDDNDIVVITNMEWRNES